MRQIAATAGEFVVSCAVICSDSTTELPKLEQALNKFTKWVLLVVFADCNVLISLSNRKLGGIAKDCEELSGLNWFRRYLQNTTHKNDLQGIRTKLNVAIELFQVG
jgi:hypothetical protein